MRRAMASTMNIDSMGFADPTPDGPSPGPMALGELDHGHGSARARDSAGRYVRTSDESSLDPRALRDSEPDPRDLRESGPTTDADGRALRASGTPTPASPTATLFATTGEGAGGDGDTTPLSQAHIAHLTANQDAKASACATSSRAGVVRTDM